ncbi:TULIP family P47-like protein [Paracoccus fistulariae]|uniref:TULIP family P47-like protein n=1 Tax=Paracoccus fistulariae TaxID=658446 RepID=A0ABY7SK47_9RHOB|nr:TULIP family P47-like protein [Paracoccus fistulariae]MDB6183166.1 TULIP family P47-like protein [Paracoccus fistulariae]WCR07308.1 TULIP family P47-like protein [Paracoccus fistulariae]
MTSDTDTGSAVYTHGWDTVFAIPVPDVNKAIVDKKSSPPSFSFTDPSNTFKLDGTFGDWQMTEGGDGKEVRMYLPLTAISLTFLATGKKTDYSGNCVIGIELHYIPHTDPQASAAKGANPMALKVKPTSDDPTQSVAFVVDMPLTPTPGTIAEAMLKQGMQEWASANLAEFGHVFAVVDLNTMIDQGQWGFVAPNYTSYAYLTDGSALANDLFGVLTMTGKRSGSTLNEQLPENAIPSGSKAGFLVSQTRTLYDLIRPSIMQAYPGLTGQNFLMDAAGDTLYLTENTSVDLKTVHHNGTPYYPKLTQLKVKSVGSVLTLTSTTETEVAAGIVASCVSTHWYTVDLGKSNKGQTLKFTEYQKPSIVHSIHQSEGSHVTQIIIMIVASIALLILTILTEGAALIVGGLVIGLLLGTNQIVPALIEKVNKDDSPDIGLLLANAVAPITWSASGVFDLTYGHMNNALQLGGNPKFI